MTSISHSTTESVDSTHKRRGCRRKLEQFRDDNPEESALIDRSTCKSIDRYQQEPIDVVPPESIDAESASDREKLIKDKLYMLDLM